MTTRVASSTQLGIEIEQSSQEKGMSRQELVAKHMNEGKNIVNMSFEEQHESFPSILKVIREEEDLSHNDEITSRNNELEKFQRVENDLQELKTLVAKEDESTSRESHETINEEVETIMEMTSWAFVQEEFSSKDIPYILEVDEPIVSFHEIKEPSIVNKTIKSFQDNKFKLLIEHNYCLLEKDGGKNHQLIPSRYSQARLEKIE